MVSIRIVTDSTADLPAELAKEHNITVVPLNVIFGEETYVDGVEISTDQFYKKLTRSPVLPITSQPSPGKFLDTYRPFVDEEAKIVSVHISELMSGTIKSARLAQGMLKYPQLEVFDSQAVSISLGARVLEAARAAEKGCSLQEIKGLLKSFDSRHRIFFSVDSLEYLQRGGRIGKATAFLGTLLNIKPLLTIKGGEVFPWEKVRGSNRALGRMVEIVREEWGPDVPLRCFVIHGNSPDAVTELEQQLKEHLNIIEMFSTRAGPIVGTHAGPSAVGFIVWQDA